MDNQNTERLYKYDIMRFLLMFLVILGHMMELFSSGWVRVFYKIIYTFHVPAFMFVTGKFAKFDAKRVLKHLCLPYIVFQILYLIFYYLVLAKENIQIQFTTPYWILWYLLATIFCYLLIPLLPKKGSIWSIPVVALSFLVSIFVGYEKTIGYFLSLSRFFVFLPFFLWGYYQDTFKELICKKITIKPWIVILILIILIGVGQFFIIYLKTPIRMLYGARSFAESNGNIWLRILILFTASMWIIFLCNVIPNIKISVISALGRNTMPVFILHAFIIKLLEKFSFFNFSQPVNFLFAVLFALVIYLLIGNHHIGKAFKIIF